jgi:hypothetical protein
MTRAFLLLAAILAVRTSHGLAAQEIWVWRELTPAGGAAPEARRNGAAVYDPVMKRVVLFGGNGQSGLLNDTWAFDLAGRTWTRLQTTGTPPGARLGHNAVYDPVDHQMLVWAGQQGSSFFNDTRALDLATLQWRDLTPASRPTARYGSASVFDPEERRLVQFAGFTEEGTRFQDTQAFSIAARTWQDLTPSGARPEVRCLLTAALDRASRRMIVYGGQRNGPLDDLWAFDLAARTWRDLTPAERPSGRFFASSFVSRSGRFMVFGGSTPSGNTNETWAFSFATGRWERLAIAGAPSERNGMMEAYLESEDRLIVFGGTGDGRLYNDVWELARVDAAEGAPVHLAQIANGEGWSSTFVLANPSATETATGTIETFRDSGAAFPLALSGRAAAASTAFTIPPLGSLTLATDGAGTLVSGWARVTSSVALGSVVKFLSPVLGTAGVGGTAPVPGFIAPVSRNAASGLSTGLAIAAVGAGVSVTCTLRGETGASVATTTRSLAANGHLAEFLEQLFPNADTRDFRGTVTVTASGGDVVATAIQLGARAGEFTTLPVTALR